MLIVGIADLREIEAGWKNVPSISYIGRSANIFGILLKLFFSFLN